MSEFLKGNFKVKRDIVKTEEKEQEGAKKIADELRKKVLGSLGGSMVYVDRTDLTWDGNE